MQVERSFAPILPLRRRVRSIQDSGKRVSNAYLTCPGVGDNRGNPANPP